MSAAQKLPDGTGYQFSTCEYWYDRKLKLWTGWDPATTEVVGYDTLRRGIECQLSTYLRIKAKKE